MTSVRGAKSGSTIEGGLDVEKERWLGRQPIGLLFILPYVIFLIGIFVYPLVVQFVISFNDFFFAAPGATSTGPGWVFRTMRCPPGPDVPAFALQRLRVHDH